MHRSTENVTLQERTAQLESIVHNLTERVQYLEDQATSQAMQIQSTMLTMPALENEETEARITVMEETLTRLQEQL